MRIGRDTNGIAPQPVPITLESLAMAFKSLEFTIGIDFALPNKDCTVLSPCPQCQGKLQRLSGDAVFCLDCNFDNLDLCQFRHDMLQ